MSLFHSLLSNININRLLAPALLLALSACQSSNVIVDYDTATDFSHFRYYQLLADRSGASENFDPLITERTLQALTVELEKEGFIAADDEQPANVLIRYFVSTETLSQEPKSGASIGLGGGSGHSGVGISLSFPLGGDKTVKETQIIIDMLNPENEVLKWRGSKNFTIGDETPEEITALINAALAEIFGFYPPELEAK